MGALRGRESLPLSLFSGLFLSKTCSKPRSWASAELSLPTGTASLRNHKATANLSCLWRSYCARSCRKGSLKRLQKRVKKGSKISPFLVTPNSPKTPVVCGSIFSETEQFGDLDKEIREIRAFCAKPSKMAFAYTYIFSGFAVPGNRSLD